MKKSNIKLIVAIALVVALILSFSVPAFATAIYDCNEMGHIWYIDEAGEYVVNECGEKICAACGATINEAGAVVDSNASPSVTPFGLPIGGGFIVIALIVGGLLLLPVLLLLLPVFILLLPVLILVTPVFGIIGLIISTIFMA